MNGFRGTVHRSYTAASTCTRQRPSHHVHVRASTCLKLVSFALQVTKVARAFDPFYAAQFLSPAMIDDIVAAVNPFMTHVSPEALKVELPAYLAAAKDVDTLNYDDVREFSDSILQFWKRTSKTEMKEWRKAAQIMFAMSPNSASCERVFSLLDCMYSHLQMHTLADHLQASLMMRYNKRSISDS